MQPSGFSERMYSSRHGAHRRATASPSGRIRLLRAPRGEGDETLDAAPLRFTFGIRPPRLMAGPRAGVAPRPSGWARASSRSRAVLAGASLGHRYLAR